MTGRSDLVVMTRDDDTPRHGYTSKSYQKALSEGLLPIYDETRHFQQDNAPIHASESTEEWLASHAISTIEWPAHSPDLNPIEHMWKALKGNLYRMFPDLWELKKNGLDIAYFTESLKKAWEAIPDDLIKRLIKSMRKRLLAIKKVRGWYTKY